MGSKRQCSRAFRPPRLLARWLSDSPLMTPLPIRPPTTYRPLPPPRLLRLFTCIHANAPGSWHLDTTCGPRQPSWERCCCCARRNTPHHRPATWRVWRPCSTMVPWWWTSGATGHAMGMLTWERQGGARTRTNILSERTGCTWRPPFVTAPPLFDTRPPRHCRYVTGLVANASYRTAYRNPGTLTRQAKTEHAPPPPRRPSCSRGPGKPCLRAAMTMRRPGRGLPSVPTVVVATRTGPSLRWP